MCPKPTLLGGATGVEATSTGPACSPASAKPTAAAATISSGNGSPELQSAFGDAKQCLHDDDQHGRLDAKKDRLNGRYFAKGRIDRRQGEHQDRTGQDEEKTSSQTTFHAVETPAGIGRQLHGFRSWQQHAKAEGAEELIFRQPTALIDDYLVHERDLCGRPTKRQKPNSGKDLDHVRERGRGRCRIGATARGG